MKILFVFAAVRPYNSLTVRTIPTGGIEKAVIFLGEALEKRGHEVHWATTLEALDQSVHLAPDVVIAQYAQVFTLYPNAKCIWWLHHYPDQDVIQRNLPFGFKFAHQVVTLSYRHAQAMEVLGVSSRPIGYGIHPQDLCRDTPKDPYKLIYTAAPFRGLAQVPEIFQAIRTLEPRATLTVCSTMGIYGKPEEDEAFRPLIETLTQMPGVTVKGGVGQKELYAALAEARFYLYPCTWPETFCLSMEEAMAHDCWPLVSEIECQGSLAERVELCKSEDIVSAYLLGTKGDPVHRVKGVSQTWDEIAEAWEKDVLTRLPEEALLARLMSLHA